MDSIELEFYALFYLVGKFFLRMIEALFWTPGCSKTKYYHE
jgi:hypothetical protein